MRLIYVFRSLKYVKFVTKNQPEYVRSKGSNVDIKILGF